MTTALLDLEAKIVKLKTSNFGIAFIDLKGAFESVSHDLIHKFYSLSNKSLGNLCKSYLTKRHAYIYNENYPGDKPELSYLKERSTPQGSKLSPSIFNHNVGIIGHWYRSFIANIENEFNFVSNLVIYADDIALIVGSEFGHERLIEAIKICVNSFRKIANILGSELEASKTEVLVPLNRSWIDVTDIIIEKNLIPLNTTIKWLGYNISVTSKGIIGLTIPDSKVFALINSCRIFSSYNPSSLDCRRYFMTYIRPVLDLWLFQPSLHKSLEKVELKILRVLLQIHQNSKITNIYKYLAYENPSTRAIRPEW